jgi:hypothetical protein
MSAPALPQATFADEPAHVGQLRDSIRRFVAAHAPREARIQWDRDHRWPRDVYAELNKLGLTALTVPEAYGGAGQDLVAAMAVIGLAMGGLTLGMQVLGGQQSAVGATVLKAQEVRAAQAWLEIADTGPGISDELRQRLFLPFSAGDSRSGSGLGLAICQEIVRALGGSIRLDPRVEEGPSPAAHQGLVARVWLPLAVHDNEATKPAT